jgi:hypothetical protein
MGSGSNSEERYWHSEHGAWSDETTSCECGSAWSCSTSATLIDRRGDTLSTGPDTGGTRTGPSFSNGAPYNERSAPTNKMEPSSKLPMHSDSEGDVDAVATQWST